MELHEQDFYLWTKQTAELLEAGLWQEVDLTNLIAEIKNMGSNDKHALKSNLRILLIHLLKWQFQPDQRSGSWKGSIRNGRNRIQRLFKNQPSLKTYVDEVLSEAYDEAMIQSEEEMGQQILLKDACIYSSKEILDFDFLPN